MGADERKRRKTSGLMRARGGTRARDKRTSVAELFGSCLGGLGRLRAVPRLDSVLAACIKGLSDG